MFFLSSSWSYSIFYKILMLSDSKVRIKETVCYDTLYYNDSVSSFFYNSHSKYNILTAYYLIEAIWFVLNCKASSQEQVSNK